VGHAWLNRRGGASIRSGGSRHVRPPDGHGPIGTCFTAGGNAAVDRPVVVDAAAVVATPQSVTDGEDTAGGDAAVDRPVVVDAAAVVATPQSVTHWWS
jgi:hypothetical protein